MTTVTTCVSSKNCPVDQVCGPDKTCVQCAGNADCAMGMLCQASKCVKPAAGCTNSLDCKSNPNNPICDSSTGKCVLCVASKDCPTNNDCINHACKPYVSCANSLDCPQGQVCETTRMRCVECIGTNDCPTTSKCVANACRAKCTSDTQCTSMGQLCNLGQGICVQCIGAMTARPTSSARAAPAPPTCARPTRPRARPTRSSPAGPTAAGMAHRSRAADRCASPPGPLLPAKITFARPRSPRAARPASKSSSAPADGLSQTVQDDCAGKAQVCVAATCVTGVCSPGKRYCVGQRGTAVQREG